MQYNNKRDKTRMRIFQAYSNQLKNKMSSQITVKDLCTEAEINRSTFYTYFSDIVELEDAFTESILNHATKRMSDYIRNMEEVNIDAYVSIILDIVRDNDNLPLYLLKKSGRQFGDKLVSMLVGNMINLGLITADADINIEDNIDEISIYMKYHLAGFAALLVDFDIQSSECDIDELIRHVVKAATEGPITTIASLFTSETCPKQPNLYSLKPARNRNVKKHGEDDGS